MVCDVGDKCGWGAALLSTVAFGSFAVPIKSPTCIQLQIDPLVFQTYKTIMNLITSFILLCILNQYDYHQNHLNNKTMHDSMDFVASNLFQFSPWGIVSGLFWVPSGVAAVYAVQHAGLAVSQGVWSSFIVLVSFLWGFGVFGEKVYSIYITCIAIALMIFGLWGMSFFSSTTPTTKLTNSTIPQDSHTNENTIIHHVELSSSGNFDWNDKNVLSSRSLLQNEDEQNIYNPNNDHQQNNHDYEANQNDNNESCKAAYDNYLDDDSRHENNTEGIVFDQSNRGDFHSKTKGLLAASFNGLWGGSVMVPMHFASSSGANTSGLNYVLSFAIGATIVTIFLWICRFGFVFSSYVQCEYYHQHQKQCCSRLFSCENDNQQEPTPDAEYRHVHRQPIQSKFKCAYQKIPSFHVKQMIIPGGLAGFMWSIGNIASMVSVDMLGEGIGYSVVQASMLISGLWGIFYFHEIQNGWDITKWFMAAISTVCGIIILSYQHVQ